MIPFTDLHAQYQEAKTEIDQAYQRVMTTSSYITGPIVDEFETTFAEYVGAEACASTGSCTTALLCALLACGVKDGEVITTPLTFVSTSESILWTGAKPRFVDIDDNYQMDVDKVEAMVNSNTRAILYVSLYGQTPDVDRLRAIADKYNLFLIEDAAHSIGSNYKGKPVGSLADLTCFSFNPVKNLGAAGDAGCITGRADLIKLARMYRDHGRKNKWDYELQGINARIDNFQALVVLSKLKYLDSWLTKKREICAKYTRELQDYVVTPNEFADSYHTYYVYVIEVPNRDEFIKYMQDNGVSVNVHYRGPLHKQPIFANGDDCPRTDKAVNNIVSLPCYHTLTQEQQDKIIGLTKEWSKLH